MKPEELQRAKELCEKATSGPWLPGLDGRKWVLISHASNADVALNYKNDAAFVAESRELMPKLVDALEEKAQCVSKAWYDKARERAIVAEYALVLSISDFSGERPTEVAMKSIQGWLDRARKELAEVAQ